LDALQAKTIALTLFSVFAGTLGNIALSRGLREPPPGLTGFRRIWGTASQPVLWLAVALLAIQFFVWSDVLSWSDLSYVVPLTASGYLINAMLVGPLLGEHMSRTRWAGTFLIFVGVLVVATETGS
jgi:drug/metabolite transporter (DMT)-like permease